MKSCLCTVFFLNVVELFFKFFSFNFVLDSSKDFDPSWQTDAQHGIKAKNKKQNGFTRLLKCRSTYRMQAKHNRFANVICSRNSSKFVSRIILTWALVLFPGSPVPLPRGGHGIQYWGPRAQRSREDIETSLH